VKDQLFFDAVKGEDLRDEAIEQVGNNAPSFKETALAAIEHCSVHKASFTTDDVWFELSQRSALPPREPRAMGAAMRQAEKAGLIRPLPEWKLSSRAICHRRPLRVWVRR
jgi:hypothetical protein